jgi:hypothetical protein
MFEGSSYIMETNETNRVDTKFRDTKFRNENYFRISRFAKFRRNFVTEFREIS